MSNNIKVPYMLQEYEKTPDEVLDLVIALFQGNITIEQYKSQIEEMLKKYKFSPAKVDVLRGIPEYVKK